MRAKASPRLWRKQDPPGSFDSTNAPLALTPVPCQRRLVLAAPRTASRRMVAIVGMLEDFGELPFPIEEGGDNAGIEVAP